MIKVLNKTKKQKKEMQAMFDAWVETYEARLEVWLQSLSKDLKTTLDFSLDSLLVIEPYIWQRFPSVEDVECLKNGEELNCIATYIGEVYRRNSSIEARWVPPYGECKIDGEKFNFFWAVESGASNSYCNPSSKFAFIVHNKSRDRMYKIIKIQLEDTEEYLSNAPESPSPEPPGRGGFSYQYFMLVEDANFGLEHVRERMEKHIAEKKKSWKVAYHSPTHLYVQVAEDYCFNFDQYYKDLKFVSDEAKEIAESVKIYDDQTHKHTREAIASCKVRIEFWGDEDDNWDYGNDYMTVLEQFMNDPGMHIYSIHEGTLFPN